MESFLSRYKNGLVLLTVLFAQLLGLALQVRRPLPNSPDGKPVRLLRYWIISAITPPERFTHGVGMGVRGIWSNYLDLRHVRQQNLDLKADLGRLRIEQASLAEDARQGQRLQQMLNFKEHYVYKTAIAQVIGTAGTDRSRLLIIDKGSLDGLANDMPVITPDGIVGKVREVFPHSAQVLAISDQSSGAGVMLQTTRIRGVLRGNASGQPQIINIMPDDRIKPGEPVVTSGGDQIYPRGLPVGVVDSVASDPDRQPYIDVIVKPGANLARLEEVLIVTGMGDSVPPTEASDLAKSEAEAEAMKRSAADVLSEKLPSIRDPNADPNAQVADPATASKDAKGKPLVPAPARPLHPTPPLHPDRFTPGASPAAALSTPGVAVKSRPSAPPTEAPRADEGDSNGSTSEPDAPVVPVVKKHVTPAAGSAEGVVHTPAHAGKAPEAGESPLTPASKKKPASSTITTTPGTIKPGGATALRVPKPAATTAGSEKPLVPAAKRPASPESTPTTGAAASAPGTIPHRVKPPTTGAPTGTGAAGVATTPKYVEPYFVKPQHAPAKPPAAPAGAARLPLTRPASEQSGSSKSPAKPTAAKPTTARPTTARPTTAKPTAAKPPAAKPAIPTAAPAQPYKEKPSQPPATNPAPQRGL